MRCSRSATSAISAAILGCRFDRHVVELELLRAAPGDVLVRDRLDAEIELAPAIEVVTRRRAVQHVRLEHRVEAHAAQLDAVIAQHVRVVLEVVADLGATLVLEQRLQQSQHFLAVRAAAARRHRCAPSGT